MGFPPFLTLIVFNILPLLSIKKENYRDSIFA